MKLATVVDALARDDVAEVCVRTGRRPWTTIGGENTPFGDAAIDRAAIVALVTKVGGARHLARGGGKWVFRSAIGPVDVDVTVGDDHVLARFRRVHAAAAASAPRASRRPPPAEARTSRRPPSGAHVSRRAPATEGRTSRRPPSEVPVSRRPPPVEPRAKRRSTATQVAVRHLPARAGKDLDPLLARARELRASDLHLVAGRPALMRVAGELVADGEPLTSRAIEQMVVPAIPDRLVAVFEGEGSCDFALAHDHHGRFRVNVSRQRTGLKASLRLLPPGIPTLASLGLPEQIAQATRHHQGLIIVTGPTGHGKTTTLAAIVDIINGESSRHVITVEDPIEFLHPTKKALMSQREVGTHTKSFASALKGSLREDPDVIIVGELRDTETVRMAVAASETGHLVISTMNTPSAAKTIDRIIDLFPPSDQGQVRMTLAGGLRLVVSQRLLPNAKRDGVVAAAEVLPGSVALWNLIRDNKTFQIPSLQQRGKALGIIRLDEALADLVKSGRTTREIALEYAEFPDELRAALDAPAEVAPPPPARPQAVTAAKEAAGALFQRAGALFSRNEK